MGGGLRGISAICKALNLRGYSIFHADHQQRQSKRPATENFEISAATGHDKEPLSGHAARESANTALVHSNSPVVDGSPAMHPSVMWTLLFFVATCTSANADEPAIEKKASPARWDDAFFGIMLEKPSRGRFWVVADTIANSDGDKLKPGDRIMEIDGKRVTVDDDLMAMLHAANDEIELRASRTVGGKRAIDRSKFKRTTRWKSLKKVFDVEVDAINNWSRMRVSTLSESLSTSTHLLPEFIWEDEHLERVLLKFQYRNPDWLFIRKLTIKYAGKTFEIARDMKREVRTGGGIKEWCTVSGKQAEEILKHIGENPKGTFWNTSVTSGGQRSLLSGFRSTGSWTCMRR
ncbi:MAG: hypothetical protein ABGZ23_05835 [Fuerstiella sp.]